MMYLFCPPPSLNTIRVKSKENYQLELGRTISIGSGSVQEILFQKRGGGGLFILIMFTLFYQCNQLSSETQLSCLWVSYKKNEYNMICICTRPFEKPLMYQKQIYRTHLLYCYNCAIFQTSSLAFVQMEADLPRVQNKKHQTLLICHIHKKYS